MRLIAERCGKYWRDTEEIRAHGSNAGGMSLGIPLKLLQESIGHVVTVELDSGAMYRGTLDTAEDNMNIQMRDITVTAREGRVSHVDKIYVRGSHIRFFVVPDMLKHAPMFKNFEIGQQRKSAASKPARNLVEKGRGTALRH
ncbi:small nuclear ribonucleoprotein Sm D3 [Savitreella phatthalungensis]